MFGSQSRKTTLILLFNWITLTFGNFTLLLSATKLHGDLFANYLMASILGDVPGTLVLLVTMKYFSRRVNIFACQTSVFICCLILAFLPKEVSSFQKLVWLFCSWWRPITTSLYYFDTPVLLWHTRITLTYLYYFDIPVFLWHICTTLTYLYFFDIPVLLWHICTTFTICTTLTYLY